MTPARILIGIGVLALALGLGALGVALLAPSDGETFVAGDDSVRATVATTAPSPGEPATTAPAPTGSPTTESAAATTQPPVTTAQAPAGSSSTTTTRPATTTTRPATTTTRPAPTPTTLAGVTPNTPPSVSINAPSRNSRFPATFDAGRGTFGATVSFSASISDPEGDAVDVQWFSSIDGFLGSGSSITARLVPQGDASQPVITVVVTDATGAKSQASTQVVVWIPSDQ